MKYFIMTLLLISAYAQAQTPEAVYVVPVNQYDQMVKDNEGLKTQVDDLITTNDKLQEQVALYIIQYNRLLDKYNSSQDTISLLQAEVASLQTKLDDCLTKLGDNSNNPPNTPNTQFEWQELFDNELLEGPGKYLLTAPKDHLVVSGGRLTVNAEFNQPKDENNRVRSEVNLWNPASLDSRVFKKEPTGVVRYYSFEVQIPDDWQYDGEKVLLFQVHGSEDVGEEGIGREPCLAIFLWNKNIYIRQLWNAQKIQTGNNNRQDIYKQPFVPGLNKFVIRVKWSYNPDGETTIWRNDQKIVNLVGPNWYNDDLGPYLKFGMYCPGWSAGSFTPGVTSHVLFFDNFLIGNSSNTPEDFGVSN